MGWGTTVFPADYDFAKVSNIAPFWAAINEKWSVIDPAGRPAGYPYPAPVAGDDISCTGGAVGLVAATIYHPARNRFPISVLQGDFSNLYLNFVDPSITLDGVTLTMDGNGQHGTLPAILYAVGKPQQLAGCTLNQSSQYDWTRKRPATIPDTTWTASYNDNAGNTANVPAAGHVARNDTNGKKYTFNGTAWSLATDQTVLCTVLSGWGLCQPGDYIGPWIYKELYGSIRLLTTTGERGTTPGSGTYHTGSHSSFTGGSPPVTIANEESLALTDWNANSDTAGGIAGNYGTAYSQIDDDTPVDGSASAYRQWGPFNLGDAVQAAPPLSRSIDYYLYTANAGDFATGGHGPMHFDLMGSAMPAYGILTKVGTDGPDTTGRTASSFSVPAERGIPTWDTTDLWYTFQGNHYAHGYNIGGGIVIYRWVMTYT